MPNPAGRPVRWGVLSTAAINRKVLAGAAKSGTVDVAAVASRDIARAAHEAQAWDIPRAYGSYEDLLADDGVEAVYIPLPNRLHHEWTMKALHAGKHVLCEKPYSRIPTEVTVAFDLADELGLVLSEAFMYRYSPQIVRLKELVESGRIGELRLITGSFSWTGDNRDAVQFDPALDGGALLDVGVYPISAARLLGGEPTGFACLSSIGPTGVDEISAGSMRHPGDVQSVFDCGFLLPDRTALQVTGTEGVIDVSDPWHGYQPGLTIRSVDDSVEHVEIPVADSYQLELEEFGRAVRREPNVLLGREDALGQARAIDALFSSM